MDKIQNQGTGIDWCKNNFTNFWERGKTKWKQSSSWILFYIPLWSLSPNQDRIFDCLCFQSMRWTYRLHHHGTWGCFRKYNEWYCWGCLHHGFKTNDNSKLLLWHFLNARIILMWEMLKYYSRLPTKNYKTSCRPITLPVRDWSGGEDELYTIFFYTIFLPDGQNITFVWDSMFEDICAAEFVFL